MSLVSAGYDQSISNPQVVVGDLVATEDEWLSAKEKLFKAVVDLHVYIRKEMPVSAQDEGTLKKARQAMNENIRTILVKHPDRPVSDIMFLFARTRAVDRDIRTQREVILHSVQQAEVWFTEIYS